MAALELSDIENSLGTYENYFSVWLREEKLEEKELDQMTERLYMHIRKLVLTKSGDIEEDEEGEENGKANKSRSLGFKLQVAVAPLVEAFLNIEMGNESTVREKLLVCKTYVAHLIENEKNDSISDYLAGFNYLNNLLEVHSSIKFDKRVSPSISLSKRELFSYEKLTERGKAIVWAARWELAESFIKYRHKDMLEALTQTARLDPYNFNWNYILAMRHRFVRRESHGNNSEPSKDEINAAARSVEQSIGTGFEAYCLAGYCQTLSEILRWRWKSGQPDEPFLFGNKRFVSTTQAITYIEENANLALGSDKVSFGELIRYSEIFSSILPTDYLDFNLATKACNKCLLYDLESSKANHRMGKIYLFADEDVNNAITCLQKAVDCGPFNFSASVDLVNTLLGSPEANQEKIQKAFDTFWKQSIWTDRQIDAFNFLYGCYQFMKGEPKAAVENWLKIKLPENSTGSRFYFEGLQRKVIKQHCWTPQALDKLKWTDIKDLLQVTIRRTRNEHQLEILEFLKENANGAATCLERNSQVPGRGLQNSSNHSRSSQGQTYYGDQQRRASYGHGPYQKRSPSPDNWRSKD